MSTIRLRMRSIALLVVALSLALLLVVHITPPLSPDALPPFATVDDHVTRDSHAHTIEHFVPDFDKLLNSEMFTGSAQEFKLRWLRQRIQRMSASWLDAVKRYNQMEAPLIQRPRRRKHILIFPGLLSEFSAYNFAENIWKGGYMGEMVAWSDFIAALYGLGHDLRVITNGHTLRQMLARSDQPIFDLVYTDYLGLTAFEGDNLFSRYKCRLRIHDSFGTDPLYNFRTAQHRAPATSDMFTDWNFEDTRQLLSFYPMNPDNSFAGYIVESAPHVDVTAKKRQGVIYGKEGPFYRGKRAYLEAILSVLPLHATTKNPTADMPAQVVNHGVVSQPVLQQLLRDSAVFVGLGFPYDGPGPMEAVANGMVFLNVGFHTPHDRFNTPFFAGKPTRKRYSSQHPYLEHYVGVPHVHTVDATDLDAVKKTVLDIVSQEPVTPLTPHEFTQLGFMQRFDAYIEKQNFCDIGEVAREGTASASTVLVGHSAQEAVDGRLTDKTCYWSARTGVGQTVWWELDLMGSVDVRRVRVENVFRWRTAKQWNAWSAPFTVTLMDAQRTTLLTREYMERQLEYNVYDEVERVRFVRISKTISEPKGGYLVLCAVAVLARQPRAPLWPAPAPPHAPLTTITALSAEPCTEACIRKGLRCEREWFPLINSEQALRANGCDKFVANLFVEDSLVDYLPAKSDATQNCAIGKEPKLYSCAGGRKGVSRVCPCRNVWRDQTALPNPLD